MNRNYNNAYRSTRAKNTLEQQFYFGFCFCLMPVFCSWRVRSEIWLTIVLLLFSFRIHVVILIGGRRENSKCPFGGVNTVEGLASSVALTERLQTQLSEMGLPKPLDRDALKTVPDTNEIWDHAANALAGLCASLLLLLSVEKIVLGGGVMQRKPLLGMIQKRTEDVLNGYLKFEKPLSEIITVSQHGADAGLLGAIALAKRAYKSPEAVDELKHVKQEAFGQGLWHGMLVGVLGTALIFKYGWLGTNRIRH